MLPIISICLILFSMFACNNFPFRAFVTMVYSTLTKVLLKLAVPLDSALPSLDFEQINVFWTLGFDSVSIVFDSLSVSSLPELNFSHSIVPSSDLERINIWFMALIPLALHSFPLWVTQFHWRLPKSCCSLDLDLSSFEFE